MHTNRGTTNDNFFLVVDLFDQGTNFGRYNKMYVKQYFFIIYNS